MFVSYIFLIISSLTHLLPLIQRRFLRQHFRLAKAPFLLPWVIYFRTSCWLAGRPWALILFLAGLPDYRPLPRLTISAWSYPLNELIKVNIAGQSKSLLLIYRAIHPFRFHHWPRHNAHIYMATAASRTMPFLNTTIHTNLYHSGLIISATALFLATLR